MSKTFVQAPKPKPLSPNAIAAFERGGPGQDRQNHQSTNVGMVETGNEPAEALRRLSIDLPESLHRRFKVACSKTDRKMQVEVSALIEKRTQELEETG
jgi:hypothetical protein